jgi:hypothetical protein
LTAVFILKYFAPARAADRPIAEPPASGVAEARVVPAA